MVKVAAMLVRMCVPDVALELHSDLQKKERKKSLGNTILREKKNNSNQNESLSSLNGPRQRSGNAGNAGNAAIGWVLIDSVEWWILRP